MGLVMGKEIGAPTKYKPEYCEQMIEFFNKEPFEYIQIEREEEDGTLTPTVATDKFGNPIRVPTHLPTKEAFATSIGVHRETLINWSKKHSEFFDAIKTCEQLQQNILIQNALVQSYDKTFSIFTAKNVMGWSDKGASDYINIDLSKCKTPLQKAEAIILDISKGRTPIDKGKALIDVILAAIKIEEATELLERIERIEAALNASKS